MPHDQLFKELLRSWFREFVELFFPIAAARLDFERVTFLDKEVFTDLPEGKLREPDLVAQAYTLDGEPELILLHVEVQAQRERDFSYRMFEYYALLRLRFKLPVFPVVLYLAPGCGGLTTARYEERLFGEEILSFRYHIVDPADLEADDYYDHQNPLAAGLSALMKPASLGRALQKAMSLRRVFTSQADEARRSLLTYVIETYLRLDEAEQTEFRDAMGRRALQEVREMVNIYEERGIEKGIAQGIEEGVTRGKRAMLLSLMRRKFGPMPEDVVARIGGIQGADDLDVLSERLLEADSLADMGLAGS